MLQLVDGDELAVANGFQNGLQVDVFAVAHIGILGQNRFGVGFEDDRFRVAFLQDEAFDFGHHREFRPPLGVVDLHADDMRLVGLAQHLLDGAVAQNLAVVVDEVDFLAFVDIVFDGKEKRAFVEVITKDGQARTVVDALHTADALVVIHDGRSVGRSLGDGALRTAERAGVAGETVEAV